MKPRRIGIIGFDQVDALDLVGPAEAFASATDNDTNGNSGSAYEVVVLGLTNSRFVAESGIVFQPRTTLLAAPALDTIIIPGGAGLRRAETNRVVARWVEERAVKTRRVVSICTGIYALAASGLLDGRRVTTHWRFAADVARRFPDLRVQPNALFIRDGNFYTSAGVTAGIDLTLALIEEDLGREAALRVARDLVVYLKRPGGQDQVLGAVALSNDGERSLGGTGQLDRNQPAARPLDPGPGQSRLSFPAAFRQAFQGGLRSIARRLRAGSPAG